MEHAWVGDRASRRGHRRPHPGARRAEDAPSPLVALSRRETAVSLAQTTIRYFVFPVAIALAVVIITNGRAVGAVAGASFVAVMIAFAAQRFLMDVIAGIVMFFEGWYTVGTSVVIEPWKLEGVVEEVSLRATKIRDASGEVLRVHNSQVLAVRVLPDGALGFEIELFVHDGYAGAPSSSASRPSFPSGRRHSWSPRPCARFRSSTATSIASPRARRSRRAVHGSRPISSRAC